MVSKSNFALNTMGKLMQKAGAKRVGEDAKVQLARTLEEYTSRLSRRAFEIALHAKRKTIKEEDVILALKESRG